MLYRVIVYSTCTVFFLVFFSNSYSLALYQPFHQTVIFPEGAIDIANSAESAINFHPVILNTYLRPVWYSALRLSSQSFLHFQLRQLLSGSSTNDGVGRVISSPRCRRWGLFKRILRICGVLPFIVWPLNGFFLCYFQRTRISVLSNPTLPSSDPRL